MAMSVFLEVREHKQNIPHANVSTIKTCNHRFNNHDSLCNLVSPFFAKGLNQMGKDSDLQMTVSNTFATTTYTHHENDLLGQGVDGMKKAVAEQIYLHLIHALPFELEMIYPADDKTQPFYSRKISVDFMNDEQMECAYSTNLSQDWYAF